MSDARNQAIAQVETIAAMIAALDVDYGRLNDLRKAAKAGHWVAGWNMPGYMPDSEPVTFETNNEALEYIADEIASVAEQCESDDEAKPLTDAAEAIRTYSGEFGQTIGQYHYWVTHEAGIADPDEAEELETLEEEAGDFEDQDAAECAIDEHPFSGAEFRSGWSAARTYLEADEFRIVLCTGGPHVEIIGDFDRFGDADNVRVLYKDWSESGELFDFDRDAVRAYCNRFVGA